MVCSKNADTLSQRYYIPTCMIGQGRLYNGSRPLYPLRKNGTINNEHQLLYYRRVIVCNSERLCLPMSAYALLLFPV